MQFPAYQPGHVDFRLPKGSFFVMTSKYMESVSLHTSADEQH